MKSKERTDGSGMQVVIPHCFSLKGESDMSLNCQFPLTFSPRKSSIGEMKTGEAVGV